MLDHRAQAVNKAIDRQPGQHPEPQIEGPPADLAYDEQQNALCDADAGNVRNPKAGGSTWGWPRGRIPCEVPRGDRQHLEAEATPRQEKPEMPAIEPSEDDGLRILRSAEMRVVQQVALTKRVKRNEEWTTQQRGDNQVVSPLPSRDQPMDALVHPQSQRVLLDADQHKANEH